MHSADIYKALLSELSSECRCLQLVWCEPQHPLVVSVMGCLRAHTRVCVYVCVCLVGQGSGGTLLSAYFCP